MPAKTILETERLLLREFHQSDLEPFYVLGSDPAVLRYLGGEGSGFTSREHALEILRSKPLSDYRKYGFGRWACVHRASGAVIGFAGLKYLDELREVDIGYRFLPAYWGQGLATEACRPIMDYGLNTLGLDRIIGQVDPNNHASIHVLEKLGLTFERMAEFHGLTWAWYTIHAPTATAGARLRITAIADELKKFQGTWRQVAHVSSGVPDPPEERGWNPRSTFVDDTFVVTLADGSIAIKGTFKIDPTREPKTVDWTDTFGQDAGKTFPAIYSLEGDRLTFVAADVGQERPKEFRSGPGQELRVCERVT